jgi:hypothetical protein
MQRVIHPVYTYDALGRLVNYTPSGTSNDVVSQHVMLDPRVPGPRSLAAGGLKPVITASRANIDPSRYVPPLSLTSPPVSRPKTVATMLGHATFDDVPETHDVYSITTSTPILNVPQYSGYRRL